MEAVNTKCAYVAPETTVQAVDAITSLLGMSPSLFSAEEQENVTFEARERRNLNYWEEEDLW